MEIEREGGREEGGRTPIFREGEGRRKWIKVIPLISMQTLCEFQYLTPCPLFQTFATNSRSNDDAASDYAAAPEGSNGYHNGGGIGGGGSPRKSVGLRNLNGGGARSNSSNRTSVNIGYGVLLMAGLKNMGALGGSGRGSSTVSTVTFLP